MEERIDTKSMGADQKDMFREAFRVFDRDGNGKISSEELRWEKRWKNFRSVVLNKRIATLLWVAISCTVRPNPSFHCQMGRQIEFYTVLWVANYQRLRTLWATTCQISFFQSFLISSGILVWSLNSARASCSWLHPVCQWFGHSMDLWEITDFFPSSETWWRHTVKWN